LIAQESDKTAVQIAQESQAFQGLQSTYDAGKQMNPNLPQHTQNDKGGDTTDKTVTKTADKGGDNNTATTGTTGSSTSASSDGTVFHAPVGTSVVNLETGTSVTVIVATQPPVIGGSSGPAAVVNVTSTVVTPATPVSIALREPGRSRRSRATPFSSTA